MCEYVNDIYLSKQKILSVVHLAVSEQYQILIATGTYYSRSGHLWKQHKVFICIFKREQLLNHIYMQKVWDKSEHPINSFIKEKTEDEDEEGGEDDQGVETAPEKPKSSTIGSPEDDLTLRASMYGVLFQSYADKVVNSKNHFLLRINDLLITKWLVIEWLKCILHNHLNLFELNN